MPTKFCYTASRIGCATGSKNAPILSRGYYYDTETGFYYLQSRYYDPVTCRFINADAPELSEMTAYSVSDSNLFAYCGNNPVLRGDAEGEFWNVVIGAAAGVLVNVVSVAVQGAITGEKPQNEDYLLAVITGAVSGGLAGAGIFVTPGQHAILGGVTSFIGSLQENGEDLGSGDPGRAGGALLNIVIDTAVGATFGYVGGTTGKASTSKIRSIWGGTKAFLRNVAENGISSGGSIIASVTTKGVYQNTYNSFRYARLK